VTSKQERLPPKVLYPLTIEALKACKLAGDAMASNDEAMQGLERYESAWLAAIETFAEESAWLNRREDVLLTDLWCPGDWPVFFHRYM